MKRFSRTSDRTFALLQGFALVFAASLPLRADPPAPTPSALVMTEERLRLAQHASGAGFTRTAYERVIHFYGDSIGRGLGFIEFEDPSPLSRIQDIATLLLRDNESPPGALVVRYAWTQDPARITADYAAGLIRPGDMILFEDAGPHENDIPARRRRLEAVVAASRAHPQPAELVFTTMFDFEPGPAFSNSRYDAPIAETGFSMNDLLRRVAAEHRVTVLDWNALMDRLVAELAPRGITVMHEDGVHANALGNFALAVSILRHTGLAIRTWPSVARELAALDKVHVDNLHLVPPLSRPEAERILAEIAARVPDPICREKR